MEELAIKIAEMLDISVQGAIDIYPVIRTQYIWCEVLTTVCFWSVILWFGSIVITGISWVIRNDTTKFNWRTKEITEEWANIDKVFKAALSAFVLFLVVTIASAVVAPFLAPDIMLIKNFLG